MNMVTIGHTNMLELKRWNTPTIYNGWEQITTHDIATDGINLEETRDFIPQMGPMVGRDCPVTVFGREIKPGQLIHADKHGFLAVPEEDEEGLLEAAQFMDSNECNTMIAAARSCSGKPIDEVLTHIDKACAAFGQKAKARFNREGEW